MKNKKGFTLMELLCTIAIMGLIASAATINISTILKEKRTAEEQSKNEIIEVAACTYIELSKYKDLKEECLQKGCELSTESLIKEGLLNEEDIKEERKVKIYKENNEKKCKIK